MKGPGLLCRSFRRRSEEDWGTEYLDYILSLKSGWIPWMEAIDHINTYNTGHSEAIITRDYEHARGS